MVRGGPRDPPPIPRASSTSSEKSKRCPPRPAAQGGARLRRLHWPTDARGRVSLWATPTRHFSSKRSRKWGWELSRVLPPAVPPTRRSPDTHLRPTCPGPSAPVSVPCVRGPIVVRYLLYVFVSSSGVSVPHRSASEPPGSPAPPLLAGPAPETQAGGSIPVLVPEPNAAGHPAPGLPSRHASL